MISWHLGDFFGKSRKRIVSSMFSANPDLVDRIRSKQPLYKWDRNRFYGPFPDNEIGYTVFPTRHLAARGDAQKAQLAD